MVKSRKQYRGCIATNLLDKKSWSDKPRTNRQKWELTRHEAETMRSQMQGLPIRLDHNKKYTVGKVLDAYITDDNKWEIDFEIDDDEYAVTHVLENKYPVELSLSHYMHLQKPEEVSLCWVGCREGCQVYDGDKTNEVQNDDSNQCLPNNELLVQASISQVLTPLDHFASKQSNDPQPCYYQLQPFTKRVSEMASQASAQQLPPQQQNPAFIPQQQQQLHQSRPTMQPPAANQQQSKQNILNPISDSPNSASQNDGQVAVDDGIDKSMERFNEVMDRVLDVKTLSGNDKKTLGDGVLKNLKQIQELEAALQAKTDAEEAMKAEIEQLRNNELRNKEHMKAEVDKLCESWLSMPGVQWQQSDKEKLRQLSSDGSLDKLCQAVGPQLVQCSIVATNLYPTQEEQEQQQAYQEEQERVLPWNQQIQRVMNQRNIGMRPFDGSKRVYNNATNSSASTIDPVRCSVKRSHQQAFDQPSKPTFSSKAIEEYRPSRAMMGLPDDVLSAFADATKYPQRYDTAPSKNGKRASY